MTTPLTIDIHAHHFPTGLGDFAARTGDGRWPSLRVDEGTGTGDLIMRGADVFRRVTPACHNPWVRIGEMDAAAVDHQVVSPVPVTLVDWAPAELAAEFHHRQNEGLAEAVADSDGRLLALGAVPMQDTDLALTELARARDELGMAGIEISAMPGDRELDDPALDPFWAAAAAERVPVFVHPAHQATAVRRRGMPYEFGIGMLTDTALAAAALVYGGVLDRHPGLRVALAHGCGAFAWTHPRLRYMATRLDPAPGVGDHLDDLVRTLWVDALVFDPVNAALLVERFGADHVLYGTDHPFLPEGFDGPRDVIAAAIGAGSGLDDRCLGANALAFLGLEPAER
jgi:aminocarboxymuconate-semialdehyde decarboxylase